MKADTSGEMSKGDKEQMKQVFKLDGCNVNKVSF